MPHQNRITPSGTIVASDFRGTWMGNRGGRIHNPVTKALLKKRWASKQWIICVLDFKNRHREIMSNSYTELFFYDEASALAAGHRPCFECRRQDAKAFSNAWAKAKGLTTPPKAGELDFQLHTERTAATGKKIYIPLEHHHIHDGIFVRQNNRDCVIVDGRLHPWSDRGYGKAFDINFQTAQLITPPSSYLAIKAGYRPIINL